MGPGTVTDNVVAGVTVSGDSNGYGAVGAIDLHSGPHEVSRNFITGLVPVGNGTARGISGSGVGMSSFNANTVANAVLVIGIGIDGGYVGSGSQAVCRDNTVNGANCDNGDAPHPTPAK